eukprot:NODE_13412_length_1167_cov_9.744231.p1 GENE.NODE_13412_length_1167_cov_9.744231~~NODE_13412_length_1167_cov_9.744231.p1  ORF type:complete len:374 (-),score=35.55 NODE_13412_length_1167_cov_9.744231:45-1073(-)
MAPKRKKARSFAPSEADLLPILEGQLAINPGGLALHMYSRKPGPFLNEIIAWRGVCRELLKLAPNGILAWERLKRASLRRFDAHPLADPKHGTGRLTMIESSEDLATGMKAMLHSLRKLALDERKLAAQKRKCNCEEDAKVLLRLVASVDIDTVGNVEAEVLLASDAETISSCCSLSSYSISAEESDWEIPDWAAEFACEGESQADAVSSAGTAQRGAAAAAKGPGAGAGAGAGAGEAPSETCSIIDLELASSVSAPPQPSRAPKRPPLELDPGRPSLTLRRNISKKPAAKHCWTAFQRTRKSGESANRIDTYLVSPSGKLYRSFTAAAKSEEGKKLASPRS